MSDESDEPSVEIRLEPGRVVLNLGGMLGGASAEFLATAVPNLLPLVPGRPVEIELRAVTAVTAAGADALYRWCARLAGAAESVRLAAPSPPARRFEASSGYRLRGTWPAVAVQPVLARAVEPVVGDPLFEEVSPADVLLLAGRALVSAGADRATSHLRAGGSRTRLTLIGHEGFTGPFAERFGTVGGWGTPFSLAAATGRVVEIPDVASDPLLAGSAEGEALLSAGVRSCAALPLRGGDGTVLGVLAPHWAQPGGRMSPRMWKVAAHAHQHLRAARRVDPAADPTREIANLKLAVESRGLIGTAVGIVMASSGVTEKEAFDTLVAASQRANVRLLELARQLVQRRNDAARERATREVAGTRVGRSATSVRSGSSEMGRSCGHAGRHPSPDGRSSATPPEAAIATSSR